MILVHRGRVICDAGTSHRGIGHVHPVYAEDDANGRLPRAEGRLQVLAVDPVVLQHMRHCRRVSFERNADHAFARPGALHAASCGRASTQQVPRGSAGRPAAPQTAQRVRHGGGFCIIGAFSRRRRRLHPRTSRRRNWSKCRVVTDVTRYYRDSVPEAN